MATFQSQLVTGFLSLATLAGLYSSATAQEAPRRQAIIDENPIPSARAAGMGGAIVSLADDLDSTFHNPAGIGGSQAHQKSDSLVRKLYVPWVSGSFNQASTGLLREARKSGASSDSTIAKSLIDTHAGEQQYARASIGSGLVFGRTILVPFSDSQLASTAEGNGTDLLDTHFVGLTGIGAGASVSDSEGRLALGYFGYIAQRTELQGNYLYDEMIDKDQRSALLKEGMHKSKGTGHNFGINWRLGKAGRPTFGFALINAGGTKFTGSGEPMVVKPNATAGFSVSPPVGKTGAINLALAVEHLNDYHQSLQEKYRLGTELLLGGIGSYARFGIRAGYNHGGPAAGLSLNLGLIGFEAAVASVDTGVGNERAVERRGTATIFVNAADF